MRIILSLMICLSTAFASTKTEVPPEGLAVEVHGAPQDMGHFVGVVRDPNDFFKYEFYSLTTQDPEVQKILKAMKRHDKLRVWGSVIVDGPQKHLDITK